MGYFDAPKKIFMIGIKGSGMSALADLLQGSGHLVLGSDQQLRETQSPADGYTIYPEDKAAEFITQAQLVIYSDAVVPAHPLRQIATQASIPVISYQEAVGEFSANYTTLAVTGTHGKSSTTALLAYILEQAQLDPTALVGAGVVAWGGKHARLGKGQYFVIEADEYREHFLTLAPTHIIITTIDHDHPDYFSSMEAVKVAYGKFLAKLKPDGVAVVLESVKAAHPDLPWPKETVVVPDIAGDTLVLQLPGKHMQRNAALALALAHYIGVDTQQAKQALQAFPGLERRLELLQHTDTYDIFTDYGHHPGEIAATLEGLQQKYPGKKIAVLFEPHTIERLESFFDQFVEALSLAQSVVICPVFYAVGRGTGQPSNLPTTLQEKLTTAGTEAVLLPAYADLQPELEKLKQSSDVIVAFTAGNLDGILRQCL